MAKTLAELQEQAQLAQELGDIDAELEAREGIDSFQAEPSGFPGAGFIEPAAAIVSGAVLEPIAGVAGIIQGLNPFAEEGAGVRAIESTRGLAFQPRTEAGQAGLQAAGEAFAPVGEALQAVETVLGESAFEAVPESFPPQVRAGVAAAATALPTAALEAIGVGAAKGALPALKTGAKAGQEVIEAVQPLATQAIQAGQATAQAVFDFQSPAKQRIAQLIEEGAGDIDTAKFQLTETGKVAVDKVANETIKQGFDKAIIANVKTASKADKLKMLKMTNIMEKGKRNARFAAENRPSDVVGDTLLSKVKVIRNANRSAGNRIDDVAKSLVGKEIDITNAIEGFANNLENFGVSLVDDGKGGFKPDFELSELAPGDRGPLKEVIRQMNLRGKDGVDAFSAHRMKRIIDRNVTFGKTKTGLGGDAERALKQFRTELDESLDSTFPRYDKVNTIYSETIGALDSLQSALGTKLDLGGPQADKALGTKLRTLLSNNANRINLLDAASEIDNVARKRGAGEKLLIEGSGLGKDDLINQILFVDELDSRFGPIARTSFQGQIKQAVTDVGGVAAEAKISPVTAGIKGVASVAEKLRGINDENAFKSIKELLSKQNQ